MIAVQGEAKVPIQFFLFEGNLLLVLLQIEHSLKRNFPRNKKTSFFRLQVRTENKLSNEVILSLRST